MKQQDCHNYMWKQNHGKTQYLQLKSTYHDTTALTLPLLVAFIRKSVSPWLSGRFQKSNSNTLKGSESIKTKLSRNQTSGHHYKIVRNAINFTTSIISSCIASQCIAYCCCLTHTILSNPVGTRWIPSNACPSLLYKSCIFHKNVLSTSWGGKKTNS